MNDEAKRLLSESAGLKFIETTFDGQTNTETTLLAEYVCCGNSAELTLSQVKERAHRHVKLCRKCSAAHASRKRAERIRWTPRNPGPVEGANLEVLGVAKGGMQQDYTSYNVFFLCCNTQGTLSDNQMQRRINHGITLCADCSRRKNGVKVEEQEEQEKPEPTDCLEPWYHGWAPPSIALELPRGWMPR